MFNVLFMANKGNSISVFDSEVFVKGDVISNGMIDVGGKIDGKIISNSLTIKEGGVVVGDIFVNDLCISNNGCVNGNIVANKIHLSKEAKVNGNLFYNIISIEDGAILEGSCSKLDDEKINEQIVNAKNGILPSDE